MNNTVLNTIYMLILAIVGCGIYDYFKGLSSKQKELIMYIAIAIFLCIQTGAGTGQ